MFTKTAISGPILAMVFLVSGCGDGGNLDNVNAVSDGPDEFAVLPGKPLQTPTDFANLPVPTPGGSNATDPTPIVDAVAALGGNPAAVSRTGIPAADSALLAHTGRYGVSTDIRSELAGRNPNRQRGRGFFGRLFNGIGGQALDKYRELERLRAAGIRTPSAPPKP